MIIIISTKKTHFNHDNVINDIAWVAISIHVVKHNFLHNVNNMKQ